MSNDSLRGDRPLEELKRYYADAVRQRDIHQQQRAKYEIEKMKLEYDAARWYPMRIATSPADVAPNAARFTPEWYARYEAEKKRIEREMYGDAAP